MKRRSIVLVFFATLSWFLLTPTITQAARCIEMGYIGFVCYPEKNLTPFRQPITPEKTLINYNNYARVSDYANYYAAPSFDAPVVQNVGDGFLYSTIYSNVSVDGQLWYEINPGQFTPAENLKVVEDSTFHGFELRYNPERPFGWIVIRDVLPSREPGGEPTTDFYKMYRYEFFQIFDAVHAEDGWIWYYIGAGRWIPQTAVSVVDPKKRPEGVGPEEYWVEVDLYEQTTAAYVGDKMVYASLISTGLNQWPTNEGLFQVWERVPMRKMSGAEGRKDYYFIEDVPYILFFDWDIALHGAYWHDRFGYKHSHGCVNMPPRDAEWVFNWSAKAPNDLWVWVHTSAPENYFSKYKRPGIPLDYLNSN